MDPAVHEALQNSLLLYKILDNLPIADLFNCQINKLWATEVAKLLRRKATVKLNYNNLFDYISRLELLEEDKKCHENLVVDIPNFTAEGVKVIGQVIEKGLLLKAFKTIGRCIKRLKIVLELVSEEEQEVERRMSPCDYCELLSHARNLEDLTLTFVYYKTTEENDEIQMENTLSCLPSSSPFTSLKTLSLTAIRLLDDDRVGKIYEKIVELCPSLTGVGDLSGTHRFRLFLEALSKIPGRFEQIEQLKIFPNSTNIHMLASNRRMNLKRLVVSVNNPNSSSVQLVLLNYKDSLVDLKINLEDSPRHPIFGQSPRRSLALPQMKNLQSLQISLTPDYENGFRLEAKETIEHLPYLFLQSCKSFDNLIKVKFFTQNLGMLDALSEELFYEIEKGGSFPSVKIFQAGITCEWSVIKEKKPELFTKFEQIFPNSEKEDVTQDSNKNEYAREWIDFN